MTYRTRYVYVISSTVGITKIGIAESTKKRLDGMQTDSPVQLSLFNSIKLPYKLAKEVEVLCHNELAEFRSHREWFKVDPKIAWECVQKHANAVMNAADIDHTERRRREEWLISVLQESAGAIDDAK